MHMQAHITLKSSNTKTGKIPVTTTEKASCPSSCPFKDNGCYANDYHLNMHWNKVSNKERGTNWETFCQSIAGLKEGQLWRHNQAGDLPSNNGKTIDVFKLMALVEANKGKRGFTYTHYPLNGFNGSLVKSAISEGFTINASTETLAQADALYSEGFPVTVVLDDASVSKGAKTIQSPAGNTIAICPAQTTKGITCETCALCQKADRKVIVGFLAHGASKAKVIKILSVKGN